MNDEVIPDYIRLLSNLLGEWHRGGHHLFVFLFFSNCISQGMCVCVWVLVFGLWSGLPCNTWECFVIIYYTPKKNHLQKKKLTTAVNNNINTLCKRSGLRFLLMYGISLDF